MSDEKITGSEKLQPVDSRPMVLIAETDPATRQMVAYFLKEAGYAVDFAGDGYAALDRVRLDQPALLITDVLLPHLDGLALCRLLKKDPATSVVPILVYAVFDAETHARESGGNGFTQKPVEKNRLLNLVSSLISSKPVQENV